MSRAAIRIPYNVAVFFAEVNVVDRSLIIYGITTTIVFVFHWVFLGALDESRVEERVRGESAATHGCLRTLEKARCSNRYPTHFCRPLAFLAHSQSQADATPCPSLPVVFVSCLSLYQASSLFHV